MSFGDLDRYKLMRRSTFDPIKDINSLQSFVNDIKSLLHGLEKKDEAWIGKSMELWWILEETYAYHLVENFNLSEEVIARVDKARTEMINLIEQKIEEYASREENDN